MLAKLITSDGAGLFVESRKKEKKRVRNLEKREAQTRNWRIVDELDMVDQPTRDGSSRPFVSLIWMPWSLTSKEKIRKKSLGFDC